MRAGPPKQVYSRVEARRMLGVTERQLRGWETQKLLPRLEQYAFPDLIAVSSLKKLREDHVSTTRIRRAVEAVREKLRGVQHPLRELKLVAAGRDVAVVLDGQKVDAVSGQLLLDFDAKELASLLAFPTARPAPNDAETKRREAEEWFERGLEMEQCGAPVNDIIEAYEKAIGLDPRSAGAMVNLGTIHYHLRAWEDAERFYRLALSVDNGYALAHFNLGNLYDETGNAEDAAFHYHAALKVNPDYADVHYNLALLCQGRGETMKAVLHWKSYLRLDKSSSWSKIARRELEKLRRATVVEGGQAKDREKGA